MSVVTVRLILNVSEYETCPLTEGSRTGREGTLVGALPDVEITACHPPVKP